MKKSYNILAFYDRVHYGLTAADKAIYAAKPRTAGK